MFIKAPKVKSKNAGTDPLLANRPKEVPPIGESYVKNARSFMQLAGWVDFLWRNLNVKARFLNPADQRVSGPLGMDVVEIIGSLFMI
jgi:hypothetical protein